MGRKGEPAWTDLPPEERARRLAEPITVQTHGRVRSWSGCNINENRDGLSNRVLTRDQWYTPWREDPSTPEGVE